MVQVNAYSTSNPAYTVGIARQLPNKLFASVAFATEYDGQIIEDLDIVTSGNPVVINHKVTFRSTRIYFNNGAGLLINDGGALSQFTDLSVLHSGLPGTVTALPDDHIAVLCDASDGVSFERLVMRGGASNFVAEGCSNLALKTIQGDKVFGDDDQGSFIRAYDCPGLVLSQFESLNPLTASHTGDIVYLENCHGAKLRTGILDGNNSPIGAAIRIRDSRYVQVDDVDLAHMAIRAVMVEGGYGNKVHVHVRDGHNTGQGGRAAPSNAHRTFTTAVGSDTVKALNTEFKTTYYNIPNAGSGLFLDTVPNNRLSQAVSVNKPVRDIINIRQAWEFNRNEAPVLLVLNGPDGTGEATVHEETYGAPTTIGKLYAESNNPDDVFTYTLVNSAGGKFTLAGNLIKTQSDFNFNLAEEYIIRVRAVGKNGMPVERDLVILVDESTGSEVDIVAVTASALVGGKPTLDAPAAVINRAIAIPQLVGAKTVINSALINQAHVVVATGIVIGHPDVPRLPMAVRPLVGGKLTIGTVTVSQEAVLTAKIIEMGAYTTPRIDTNRVNIAGITLAAFDMEDDPVFEQDHFMKGTSFDIGKPTLGTPNAGEIVP